MFKRISTSNFPQRMTVANNGQIKSVVNLDRPVRIKLGDEDLGIFKPVEGEITFPEPIKVKAGDRLEIVLA